MIIFCLQATNNLPKEILFDYAYIDNIKKVIILDTYHRTSLNYTQLAAYIYEKNAGKVDRRRIVVSGGVSELNQLLWVATP